MNGGILRASRKFRSSSSTWSTAWPFYQWQKQLFEGGSAAFERKSSGKSAEQRRIEQLQAKLINKNEVIAELMEENVKAKKECGEL